MTVAVAGKRPWGFAFGTPEYLQNFGQQVVFQISRTPFSISVYEFCPGPVTKRARLGDLTMWCQERFGRRLVAFR